MGIRDWLFERQRNKEAWAFFEEKLKEHEARPEPQGLRSAGGNPVCPHCNHEFSLIETMEQQTVQGLPVFECPRCRQAFKL